MLKRDTFREIYLPNILEIIKKYFFLVFFKEKYLKKIIVLKNTETSHNIFSTTFLVIYFNFYK